VFFECGGRGGGGFLDHTKKCFVPRCEVLSKEEPRKKATAEK